MGRLIPLWRYHARAYYRRYFRPGGNAGRELVLLVVLAFLVFARYIGALRTAAAEVANGEVHMFTLLLAAVLVAAWFPLAEDRHAAAAPRRLLTSPLTLRQLFLFRVGLLFLAPGTWVLLAASAALAWPVPRFAVALFLIAAWALGLSLAHLMSFATGRVAAVVLAAASVAVALLPGTARAIAFHPAAMAPLSAIAALCTALAFYTFRLTLHTERTSGPRPRSGHVWFPGRFGALVQKDLRSFLRWLDAWPGAIVALPFTAYVATAATPSSDAFLIALLIIALANMGLALNCFGLESPGAMNRYALLPLSGRDILFSKNLALFTLSAVECAPAVLVAFPRLGWRVASLGAFEIVAMICAATAFGNFVSVRYPSRVQPYRFSSGSQIMPGLVGFFITVSPGVAAVAASRSGGIAGVPAIALLAVVCALAYRLRLPAAGGKLDDSLEHLRDWLA